MCTIQWEKKNVDREAGHVLAHCSSAVPGGLVVRIRRSHRRGRGSIPRLGTCFQVGPNKFDSEISLCTFIYDMSISRVKPVVLKLRAPSEDRTHDPWFTRPVLYPLSYGGHFAKMVVFKDVISNVSFIWSLLKTKNAALNRYWLFYMTSEVYM